MAILAVTMVCAGCVAVEPGYKEASRLASASLPISSNHWQAAAQSVRGKPIGWIEAFQDPTLVSLVEEAQNNNSDLASAAAAVDRARALAKLAGADLSPKVDGVAGTSNSGNFDGDETNSYNIGFEASWEADVWGRIRSGKQSEIANFQATQADFRFAQYTLAANIAISYFSAIEAVRQERITRSIVNALAETDRIVDVRVKNGLASAQDQALSKSELATARDQLEEIRGTKRETLRILEVLIGRYPSAKLVLRKDFPKLPPLPPSGLPSELLERRPDLIAAERRIAASVDALDAARAAKLPRFSLTTSLGAASSDLSNLFDPENLAWSIISNLLAPLIDGGRLDSEEDIESADLDEAVADYVQTALDAFSEVEQALDQSTVLVRRRKALKIAQRQASEAFRLAQVSYKTGETDLIDVLDIQQTVLDAQTNLLSVERALRENFVTLNLALGGHWLRTKTDPSSQKAAS